MNFCPSTNKNTVTSQMSPRLSLDPATSDGDDLARRMSEHLPTEQKYPELQEHILGSPNAPSEDSISRFQVLKS